MEEKQQTIIKKLMNETLSEAEDQQLLNDSRVKEKMNHQWEYTADSRLFSTTKEEESRIWRKIQNNIDREKPTRYNRFYKYYSIAASLLLLLGISSSIYMKSFYNPGQVYTITSGIQNIESLSLPDGTSVMIGAGSKLTYPSNFSGKNRDVNLSGQAFFDVKKDEKKPFIVHTSHMDITALGTGFEVYTYESESRLETILLNGKVRIKIKDSEMKDMEDVILSPNEMLVYDLDNYTVEVNSVNADKYSAWRNHGILTFENEKLSMIIRRLEHWYGRKIICPVEVAENHRFTFKVRDESLERILFMFTESSPISYRKIDEEDYELYIRKK